MFFNISVCRHPCPQFSNLTFTQGVAIGLDLFKPFQGFFRGYQLSILNSQFSIPFVVAHAKHPCALSLVDVLKG